MKEDRIPRAVMAFSEGVLGHVEMVEIFKCLPDDVKVVRAGVDFQSPGTSALILESLEFPPDFFDAVLCALGLDQLGRRFR